MDNHEHDYSFDDGTTWVCTSCHLEQLVDWDDDLEDTVGLPAFQQVNDDGTVRLLCEACVGDRTADDLI